MIGLELVVALCLAILIGTWVAHRLHVAPPVALVAAGSLLAFVPQLHGVGLPPEVVLLLFLPVLLYWESLTTSLREIRRFLRGIVLTGTLLVVVTAAAIAFVLHALGVEWGPAWIIGAALAPTDATAVAALGRGMPLRQRVILQAESLSNDGTALVIYSIALTFAIGQGDVTPLSVTGMLLVSMGGALIIGLGVAWVMFQGRRLIADPRLVNLSSLLTPFIAYLLAEMVHASGVLAVVVCGLYMSQLAPRGIAADARQQGAAFWTLLTFILNGALFVLVGIQLPSTVRDLSTDTVGHALLLVGATYVTMLVTRFVFLNVSIMLTRLLDRRPQQRELRGPTRGRLVSTVAGFRGAVSLAVALSVPERVLFDADFPARDLIIFITGTVVVLSLVIQGFALPRVIRWARLPEDTTAHDELMIAKTRGTEAALRALPRLADELSVDEDVADQLYHEYSSHLAAFTSSDADSPDVLRAHQYRDLKLALIGEKRRAVVALRDEGTIDDTVLRTIQAALDTEEVQLSTPPQFE